MAAQQITGPRKALCILIFFSNEAKLRQNKHPEQVSKAENNVKKRSVQATRPAQEFRGKIFRGGGEVLFVFQLFGGSAIEHLVEKNQTMGEED